MWYFSFSDLLPLVLHSLKLSFISWDRDMDTKVLTLGAALWKFYIQWKEIGQWQLRNERRSHAIDLHRKMIIVSVFYSFITVVLWNTKERNEEKQYCFCSFWVWHFTVGVFFFFNLILFVYVWPHWVFTAMHGLSPAVVSPGYSLIVVHGLLIVVAFRVVEHGLPRGWGLQ